MKWMKRKIELEATDINCHNWNLIDQLSDLEMVDWIQNWNYCSSHFALNRICDPIVILECHVVKTRCYLLIFKNKIFFVWVKY